ncbi:LuxR C-terminal-related transcriptional regulator, partial [Mycolicibacterium sp. CBMA 361]
DGVVLSSAVTRTVVEGYLGSGADPDAANVVARLTQRERDVLELIAEGLSNAEVGLRLHLSTGTVKDHVSAILNKTRVTSRVQAALLAERAGLLRRSREAQ